MQCIKLNLQTANGIELISVEANETIIEAIESKTTNRENVQSIAVYNCEEWRYADMVKILTELFPNIVSSDIRFYSNKEQLSSSVSGMKFDTGKLQYHLIPPETLKALAEVLTFGAQKYAPNNWQLVENGETRYLDALIRHLEAYRSGELIDIDSGFPHLSHVLTNAAFLHYLTTKD